MVLLLGLIGSAPRSRVLQKTVTDATNDDDASGARDDEIAGDRDREEQSQRGIIDIETLGKTTSILIDTISGVLKIQQEGHNMRLRSSSALRAHRTNSRRGSPQHKYELPRPDRAFRSGPPLVALAACEPSGPRICDPVRFREPGAPSRSCRNSARHDTPNAR